jgi:uncharacterized protein YjgD (DUF1641 family)
MKCEMKDRQIMDLLEEKKKLKDELDECRKLIPVEKKKGIVIQMFSYGLTHTEIRKTSYKPIYRSMTKMTNL